MKSNSLIYKILLRIIKLWWSSPWGLAIIHASFNKYKNSRLFKIRKRHSNSIKAAKMLTIEEFKLCRDDVLRNKKLMFTIIFRPVMIRKKFEKKNDVFKKFTRF